MMLEARAEAHQSGANRDGGEPFLKITDVRKKFGEFTALRGVSLAVREGEFVCFLGPSGCGKTTLLRAIAGLDIQTSGQIIQAGRDISALPASERDFGIVFQSYALFPNLKVHRNIAYGLENKRLPRDRINARVSELLELVGLPDQGEKYPAQLSGGQQQRVALARALATSPGLLLLDEPLSALDAKVRTYLRHEIKELQRRLGVTTIMVTHDQEEALTMADRIVVMNHGVIEQIGSPVEIYREPATLFVADFIGSMNQLPGKVAGPEQVALGSAVFKCAPHGFATGEEVTIVIRPEDAVPRGEGDAAGDAVDPVATPQNVLRSLISEMEFLGSFWRARLRPEGIDGLEFLADFSINAVRRLKLVEGGHVLIELLQERIKVFKPEA